jgi:tRNA-(ms[2]io[6]A)-hydroxylase
MLPTTLMRRLPVLQSADTDDAVAASRPAWHWLLIGAGLTATIWAPLALVAVPIGARLVAHAAGGALPAESVHHAGLALLGAAPALVAFAVAAGLAGALVGRFGGRAGPREAALGGALTGAGVTLLAAVSGDGMPLLGAAAALGALGAVGAVFGFVGGTLGHRRRPVLGSPR